MPQLSFRTSLLDALTVTEEEGAIVALDWGWGRDQAETPLLRAARTQIEEYLDGGRRAFNLPLRPCGTSYRRRVWAALGGIPFGQTRTYAEVAALAGGGARSVGGANGANPIPILIPCHRVVAAAGLGGYSGGEGLETKRRLLQLERRASQDQDDGPAGQGRNERRAGQGRNERRAGQGQGQGRGQAETHAA